MSRLVQEFSSTVTSPEGASYAARVRGDEDGSIWFAWIEFLPLDGGPALRTDRETTQSTYEHLQYWASGLSADYMVMALRRAHLVESKAPPRGATRWSPAEVQAAGEGEAAGVVHLEVETLDPTLPRRLMLASTLVVGRVRQIPGGGVIVYEGVSGEEGRPSRHAFLVQFGSANAAAVVANHLWSELHGQGATLRVNGVRIATESHELSEAFKAALEAPL
jgi:hypothetical protein